MNAKEYLEYVRSLEVRLRMKEERIAQLQHDICSLQALDYAKDKIKFSAQNSFKFNQKAA